MTLLLLGIVLLLAGSVTAYFVRRNAGVSFVASFAAAICLLGLCVVATIPLFVFAELDFFGAIHLLYLGGVVGVPVVSGALALVAIARRQSSRGSETLMVVLAVAPAALGIYGTHIEPYRLRTDRYAITVPGMTETVRIGVLSDFQTTGIGWPERRAVRLLLEEQPDIVLIPGDFYQIPEEDWDESWPAFSETLQTITTAVPHVFLVEGNADTEVGLRTIIASGGGTLLSDDTRLVSVRGQKVLIGGSSLPSIQTAFDPALIDAMSISTPGTPRVLVSHYPDISLSEPAVDLVVAGHTHGGQIAIPGFGPLVTLTNVPREVAAGGLHQLGRTTMYVSTGVGMERLQAPQVRLFVRPSIGVIDLTG